MLEMGSAYLPVDEQWERYVHNCEHVYDEILKEIKERLMGLANEALKYQENDGYVLKLSNRTFIYSIEVDTTRTFGYLILIGQ